MWQVQTGAWNRFPGYQAADQDCLTYKLIEIKQGDINGGKVFFLDKDVYTIGESELIFAESLFSSRPAPGKVLIFDQNGESGGYAGGDGSGIIVVGNRSYDNRPFLCASDKRKITIRGGTKIDFDGDTFFPHEDVELNIPSILDTGAITNGKDYFLHLIHGGANLDVIASLNKIAPNGLGPGNSKILGGAHTLCANAGTGMTYSEGGVTKDHPLNGFVASDLLPHAVWCLNHRPYSEPEGMSYITALDFWSDIYNQSGSGENTKSVYQGALTRSRQYVDHVEDMICVLKELLDDMEFAAAMMGSNEGTVVAGASEAAATTGGAGGRSDTAGRRMISIYGLEEGCGCIWQWLRTTAGGGGVGSVSIGSTWQAVSTAAHGPFAQNGGKGSFYGTAVGLLAGGGWGDGAACGSRARNANHARSDADAHIGGRGRSHPMRLFG
jgi:hypothetical protein